MFNSNCGGGYGGYSLADIAAATGGNNRSNDGDWGGNGAWWIIILFLFCFMGWGDNGMMGGNRGGGAANTPAFQGAITRGDLCSEFSFNDLQNGVRGITQDLSTGFANLNSTICHQQYDTAMMVNGIQSQLAAGFSGVDNSVCTLGYQNAQLINGLENTINQNANASNIMALQNQNALQNQIQNCCCEQRSQVADIKYTMATDACAIQTAMANNTRDLLDNQNANTRAILDYLCNEKISNLQAENQSLKLMASQQAQNAYLVEALSPKPAAPAWLVPPPGAIYNPCNNTIGYGGNNGYGCGCNTCC